MTPQNSAQKDFLPSSPKKWRDELRITTGDIIKAKKEGKKVIIEAVHTNPAPYRLYMDAEIDTFLTEDTLPNTLANKVQKHITTFSTK